MPAALYSSPVQPTLTINRLQMNSTRVNGMQTACYPVDGLLASTLECFFNSSCIQLLVSKRYAIYTTRSEEADPIFDGYSFSAAGQHFDG